MSIMRESFTSELGSALKCCILHSNYFFNVLSLRDKRQQNEPEDTDL